MAKPATPSWPFFLRHPAHVLALGLGSGMAPRAPGTFGTLAAWLMFYPLSMVLTLWMWVVFLVLAFLLGVWACEVTGRDLGVPDHGAMVWDEMVAMWCILILTPPLLGWQIAAVVVFRFFDIVKPPPIRYFDLHLKGGFGVMWDDLCAAFYTLLVMAIVVRIDQFRPPHA